MMPIKGLLMRKRSNSNTIGLQRKKGERTRGYLCGASQRVFLP